jgi:tetratricopeptide (TPR) repeat protein
MNIPSSTPPLHRIGHVLLGACAVALVCAAYANHFQNDFQFDDSHTIVNNLAIRNLANVPRFFVDATTTSSLPANQAYRPGVTTLHAVDVALGGQDVPLAWAFHRSIFIIFLVLGVLAFLFMRKVFEAAVPGPSNTLWAMAGATLFCVHAANAETINYISARSDSASTLMVLLALLVRMYAPRLARLRVDLLCMALGFLVKEPALMFVPLLGLYVWLVEEGQPLGDLVRLRPMPSLVRAARAVVPGVVVAVLLFAWAKTMTPATWTAGATTGWRYVATQPFVWIHYLLNFVLPVNLCVDTDWEVVEQFWDERVFAGLLFAGVLVAWAFAASVQRHTRPVALGLLWFVVALLPTSLVPLAEVLNDHRPFFPYLGLVMAGVWMLALWTARGGAARRALATCAMLALLLGHAWGTRQRNALWGDSVALWAEAAQKAPRQGRNHMNYGVALMAAHRWKEAEAPLLRALNMLPNYAYVHTNLGIVYGVLNRQAEAETYFLRALDLGPAVPEVHGFYAEWLRNRGRHEEALTACRNGLKVSPQHARLLALENQLVPWVKQAEQLEATRRAVAANPTAAAYLDLSLAYYQNAQFPQAIEAAEFALQRDTQSWLALNNICAASNRLKEWDKALEACRLALSLQPDSPLIRNNLAEAERAGAPTP